MKKKLITGIAVAGLGVATFGTAASAFEPGTPQCFGQVHKAINGGALSEAGIDNVGDLVKLAGGQGKNAAAKDLCAG